MAAEPHTKQVQVEATLLCIEGHALWIKRFRKEQHTLLDKAYKKYFIFIIISMEDFRNLLKKNVEA